MGFEHSSLATASAPQNSTGYGRDGTITAGLIRTVGGSTPLDLTGNGTDTVSISNFSTFDLDLSAIHVPFPVKANGVDPPTVRINPAVIVPSLP